MSSSPIAALLVHVTDWQAGLAWYQQAFPQARRVELPASDFAYLDVDGVALEVVRADNKVGSGAFGTVVYWWAEDFAARREALLALGASAYRGPMEIEGNLAMCQVLDPWGNPIGLRGPAPVS